MLSCLNATLIPCKHKLVFWQAGCNSLYMLNNNVNGVGALAGSDRKELTIYWHFQFTGISVWVNSIK